MFRSVLKAAIAVACAIPALAGAQGANYPDKTVRLIVAYPPGGSTDTAARLVAEHLTRSLGQTVVVENKAGAGGIIGAGVTHAGLSGVQWAGLNKTLVAIVLSPTLGLILTMAIMLATSWLGVRASARGAESATGSSCLETSCSFSAVASRSWTALLDCGSPAVAGTILVGVELSAAMTGGGCVELGTPE